MQSTIKLQTLPFSSIRTYVVAILFICGNIALPQMFHLVPQGGAIWLPIYFFTLAGAYLYGWRVGLITAIASPVVNSLAFGMPAPDVLPAIILKSALLASAAGYAAHKTGKASIAILTAIVAFYQIAGTLGEWAICRDFALACQDFRIGIPGMLLQIFGGFALIKYLGRK